MKGGTPGAASIWLVLQNQNEQIIRYTCLRQTHHEKNTHNMGRDPSESADLDNSKITLPQMMIVAINFLIPYLTTLAEGLAGVKAEVAPRVKREAKRVLKGAMVKVCDAIGQVQREAKRGVSCRSKRSALQSISMT